MTEKEMTRRAAGEAEAAVEAVLNTFKNSPGLWNMIDPEKRPLWNGVPGIYLAAVVVGVQGDSPITPEPGKPVPMSVSVRPFARHGAHNATLADTDQAAVTAILNFLIHQGIRQSRETLSQSDPRNVSPAFGGP